MQPRTRMFRTLAGLALSMTGAALLLTWFEPVTPGIDFLRDESAARDHVRTFLDGLTGLERLSGIQVTLKPVSSTPGTTLTAVRDDDSQFVVLESGMLHLFGPVASRVSSEIGVDLPTRLDSTDIPLSQWVGLRALIEEIHDACGPDRRLVPIRVVHSDSDWQAADAVRRLLDMDGWLVR